MKFLAMLTCLLAFTLTTQAQAQKVPHDVDFGLTTAFITVMVTTVDSAATKAARVKQPTAADVTKTDTVEVFESGMRKLTKTEGDLVVYDPRNPQQNTRYSLEFIGYNSIPPGYPVLLYNLLKNDKSAVVGRVSVDLFGPTVVMSQQGITVIYHSTR